MCESGFAVNVILQSLVKPCIQSPDGDEHVIISRIPRQVPESDVPRGPDFHYWCEGGELEPASAHFLFHQLLVVAARIRAPVRITHHGSALDRNDRGAQSFLRAADVA